MRIDPSPCTSRLALVLLVSLGGFGCDADPCGPELWDACDIRDVACQQRIFDAVQCDRGRLSGAMPPVRVIDRETFRAELVESTRDAAPRPHGDATLQLLDLAPDDMTSLETSIDVTVEGTAAFYRFEEQDVTIVDRGEPMDLLDDAALLAHELVHVLQDRRYGIESHYETTETVDQEFALGAVVEGDATFHQLLYRARAEGHDIDLLRWNPFYASWMLESMDSLYEQTARYHIALSSFRYVLGARLVTTRWLDAPHTGVDSLWVEPPRTSLELMIDPGTREAPPGAPTPVRCGAPPPPAGLELIDEDSLGALTAYAFFAPSALTPQEGWRLARTVVGDQIVVFGDGSGAVTAFQWRLRADTAANAAVIEQAMRDWASISGVLIALDAEEVVFAGATDRDVLAAWSEAIIGCTEPR